VDVVDREAAAIRRQTAVTIGPSHFGSHGGEDVGPSASDWTASTSESDQVCMQGKRGSHGHSLFKPSLFSDDSQRLTESMCDIFGEQRRTI
jgi:hypothetical protein